MSVSVSQMNETSKYLFNGAIQTMAGALAGSKFITPSPVGVLWGMSNISAGAIFGATYYIVNVLVSKGLNEMLPLTDPKANQATKLVTSLATGFLAMVGGFFALKAIGITLTAAVVLNLTVYSFINALFMHFAVQCFCGDPNQTTASVPHASASVNVRV